jgi:hypothetical protein
MYPPPRVEVSVIININHSFSHENVARPVVVVMDEERADVVCAWYVVC